MKVVNLITLISVLIISASLKSMATKSKLGHAANPNNPQKKTTYKGRRMLGFKHGHGKTYYGNNETYIGGRRWGKKHGEGTHANSNRDVIYEGGWKNGLYHGQGKYTHPDGDFYEGEWKNGLYHGHGKYAYLDGDSYEGGWKDDLKHGRGTYTFPKGDFYDGVYKNGKTTKLYKLTLNQFDHENKKIEHHFTQEGGKYYYNGTEIELNKDKRLESSLLGFGNTFPNHKKTKVENQEEIKDELNALKESKKMKFSIIEIPEHAFVAFSEDKQLYILDSGGLSSMSNFYQAIPKDANYIRIAGVDPLKFRLKDGQEIAIPLNTAGGNHFQFCCPHVANFSYLKVKEFKKIKEITGESIIQQAQAYFGFTISSGDKQGEINVVGVEKPLRPNSYSEWREKTAT